MSSPNPPHGEQPIGYRDATLPPPADFGAQGAQASPQSYGPPTDYGQPVDPHAQTVALPSDQSAYAMPDQSNAAPPAQTSGPTGGVGAVKPKHSRTGAAWVALIVAAVVFIFLLIFIMQNSGPVQVQYLGFDWTMSLGVAMMFAAVLGALTAGLLGTVRILQLRARARRALKAQS